MEEEAIERDLLPGTTPETVGSLGGGNSTGKSAGGASLSKSTEGRAVPHYLRPSAGSCHDFCKYGRKHSFNLRGKRHGFPSLAVGIHSAPEKEQHHVKIPSLAEKRKKSAAKQKASAHPKTGVCDKHVILEEETPRPVDGIKSAEETEIIDQFLEKNRLLMGLEVTVCDLPSPSKKIEPYGEFESSEQGTRTEGSVLDDDPVGEMNPEEISLPAKKVEASGGGSETANVNDLQEKPHPSLESASTGRRIRSSMNPFASIKSKFMQRVPSPLKKESALSAGRSKEGNQEVATSAAKRSTVSVKLASPGKPKGTTARSLPPQDRTAGAASKKSDSRSPTNVKVLTHDDKKMQKPSPISRSSQPAFNRLSSISLRKVKITGSSSLRRPKNAEEAGGINEKVRERTLHIVEPRPAVERTPGARRTSSVPNQEKKNRVPAPVPKHGRTSVSKPAQIENKKSGRKGVSSQPDAMDPASSKLKFRRGKVVDPQPINDAPRRILFRQGRKTGDNQGSKSGRRSFKSRVSAHGAANQRGPEAEAVVLRHQDVPEKEAQGLFNEVIEETANKLVGTRKSKVKALVGAFETVISLQESKPATAI